MILLGLVIFLVFRFFRRRSGRWFGQDDDFTTNGRQDSSSGVTRPQDRHEQARAMWEMLSDDPARGDARQQISSRSGFDESEFLEGAKMFYSRFQEARDAGDWDVIEDFIAPGLLADLKRDSVTADAVQTEIMLLDAKVMDVQSREGRTDVTVFFDALMRRGASGEQEVSERTAWEFSRPDRDPDALWVLEGINKIDH